jgi:hypothetical protein
MNNKVDIEDLKISTCASCEDILLSTDDIMIPSNGDDINMICKECYDGDWANPNIEYQKCLIINKIYCPTCDDFIIGYVPEEHSHVRCPECTNYINVTSYKDVVKKKRQYGKKRC